MGSEGIAITPIATAWRGSFYRYRYRLQGYWVHELLEWNPKGRNFFSLLVVHIEFFTRRRLQSGLMMVDPQAGSIFYFIFVWMDGWVERGGGYKINRF